MLLIAEHDRLRLTDPGFASLALPAQRARVSAQVARLAATWEALLLYSLPVAFHTLITARETGFTRFLQILRVIFDERPKFPIDPDLVEQLATTNWLAHLNLHHQVKIWRQDAQACVAELQASPQN